MSRAIVILAMLLACAPAHAQYGGRALQSCRALALAELKREGARVKDVVIERDDALSLQRHARKVGGEPVPLVLTGNGSVVLDDAPASELSFICLLANEKRALFFHWLARPNAPPLLQCTRDALGDKRKCLEVLLMVAESDLTQAYAIRFQEARERDQGAGNELLVTTFRKANDEWKQYRDAECARRRDHAPTGVAVDVYQLACMVELTRLRALDMR